MALEIEGKYRVPALDPIRKLLEHHGGRFRGLYDESNVFLDTPEGRLLAGGGALRLRTWRAERGDPMPAQLTYKGPLQGEALSIREEQEVTVSDAEAMEAMLNTMGYRPYLKYRKRRERWALDTCRIELDEVPLLGTFVEVEGPDEASIVAVVDILGLNAAHREPRTYVPLLLEACEQSGCDPLTVGM